MIWTHQPAILTVLPAKNSLWEAARTYAQVTFPETSLLELAFAQVISFPVSLDPLPVSLTLLTAPHLKPTQKSLRRAYAPQEPPWMTWTHQPAILTVLPADVSMSSMVVP